MGVDTNTASALVAALRLAAEHGGAERALKAMGIELPHEERYPALSGELAERVGQVAGMGSTTGEMLALGYLAGSLAHRPRRRIPGDPSSFLMDRDLVVRGAEGESIRRLPWFEDDLFVGRQIPDISEMPLPVRKLCVENYSAGLEGEHGRFAFTSYGHSYVVEAVPVRGPEGKIEAVLGVATLAQEHVPAVAAYERTAERLDSAAEQAERRAELDRRAGLGEEELAHRRAAERARAAAERARDNAERLRSRHTASAPANPPSVTPREAEILRLASHGLTYGEIAEELVVSPTTVRTHFANVYPKLGVSDKAAAVAAALRYGLIE